jgi:DNA polymerase III subunit delta'
MTFPIYFDAKKTLNLYGLLDNFIFLKRIYIKKKLPKVLMLSGKKGSGKSTLINHLMFFIFDEENYDQNNFELNSKSAFYKQFVNNICPNIIYLSGSDFRNIKIEDIRNLKTKIFQTSISDKPRFIIFDDVEMFNNNSLNALLKIIEEPTNNNYFLLINNKSKPLLETIKSRCLDIKIIINEKKRQEIIKSLLKKFSIKSTIDPETSALTPGNFIKFDYIYRENKINLDDEYLKNLSIFLNLYKKDKDIMFIDMISFLTDTYFNKLKNKNVITNDKIVEYKRFVFDNINKFFLYNLNQNALLNNINSRINGE